MTKSQITVHCIVKNEERFIWYALQSVLPYVEKIFIIDNGSTDKTVEIIQSIESDKIHLIEKPEVKKEDFYQLRQELIEKTKTDWFLVLDGDEIWPCQAIEELQQQLAQASPKTIGFISPFLNFSGSVFSFENPSRGSYHIGGKTGFYTIRAMRSHARIESRGEYGVEGYYIVGGGPVQEQEGALEFLEKPYFHASNLIRSNSLAKDWEIEYRRKKFYQGGDAIQIPEYLSEIKRIFTPNTPVTNFSPLMQKKSLTTAALWTARKAASALTAKPVAKKAAAPESTWEDERYYDMAKQASEDIQKNPGMRTLANVLPLFPSVLDIGCGEGTKTALLAGNREGVVGIDFSKTAIARATTTYPAISFQVGDSAVLPYKDDSFAATLTCFALEHTSDPEAFLAEMVRVTKPGGVVTMICPNFASPFFRSPCSKGSIISRHLRAWLAVASRVVRPRNTLDWVEVEPITDRPYETDFDTTCEPSIITTKQYFAKRGFRIIYSHTNWEVFTPRSLTDFLYLPFKLLALIGIFPFSQWGPEMCLIVQKPAGDSYRLRPAFSLTKSGLIEWLRYHRLRFIGSELRYGSSASGRIKNTAFTSEHRHSLAEYSRWAKQEITAATTSLMQKYCHPLWQQERQKMAGLLALDLDNTFLRIPFLQYDIAWGNTAMTPWRKKYLKEIAAESDRFKQVLDASKIGESAVGSPLTVKVGKERLTGGAIDHVHYLSTAERAFKKGGWGEVTTIVELGGGYGSMARLATRFNSSLRYIILDIPETLAIQRTYLRLSHPSLSVTSVHAIDDIGDMPGVYLAPIWLLPKLRLSADIFISTFALTESTPQLREAVAEKAFVNAKVVLLTGGTDHVFSSEKDAVSRLKKVYTDVQLSKKYVPGCWQAVAVLMNQTKKRA